MRRETLFTVITENDESEWDDVTGVSYHFPKRYLKYLLPDTNVVYYKGNQKNPAFRDQRLSDNPHYFGMGKIGSVYPDKNSKKHDSFAEVLSYRQFSNPVLAKQGDKFFEVIKKSNHWRDGVRPINKEIFQRITSLASIIDHGAPDDAATNDHLQGEEGSLTSGVEGHPQSKVGTVYERDRKLRDEAIRIHGTTCIACECNFAEMYGQHGTGYIQVHHLTPLSVEPGERTVVPKTDMTVLCANCHVMVHRYRKKTLTIEQLKTLIASKTQREVWRPTREMPAKHA